MSSLSADASEMIDAARVENPLRPRRVILRNYAVYLAVILAVLAMGKQIIVDETDWERMGSGAELLQEALTFLPNLAFMSEVFLPLLETLLMALWGTALAVVLSIPIAYIAAKNISPFYPLIYVFGRSVIVLSRSTHEIIFALLFVSALGLGPLPGILALGCRSVGFMAKTTAEAIECVIPGPIEAIEATGAGPIKVFLFGVVPQVFPIWLGNVIFQLDINLRRASILGLVGAGGIGLMFAEKMQMLEYDKAGSVVFGITVMVIAGEYISNRIRTRLI